VPRDLGTRLARLRPRCDTRAVSVTVLEREMYTEAAAARLLGVPQNTLNYWLEGGERQGKTYRPVIRVQPCGDRAAVTWGEFLEAGLLREYRRKNVPMLELRDFIDKVRDRYGVPYPLADLRLYVGGRDLLVAAQNESGLEADFCLIALVRDQPVLTSVADSFVQRVTWDGNLAAEWRPTCRSPRCAGRLPTRPRRGLREQAGEAGGYGMGWKCFARSTEPARW
jgi:hypothetical protein